MTMQYTIIKRVEYLATWGIRSGRSGVCRFRNRNHEIFSDGTEGDNDETIIEQEVVHPDIPAKLPGVELEREHTVSAIQEADTDNPESVEAYASIALANYDINLPHPNKVPRVMNEAPAVYDHEDDDECYDNYIIFDVIIDEDKNIDTQVDVEEAVEDEEANNNNDFFEDVNESDDDE